MPYCVNCGAQNPDGAKFCVNCGKSVTETAAEPGAQPSPTQPAAAPSKLAGTPGALLIAAMAVVGLGGLLQLIGGDALAVFALGLAGLIYATAYAPLQKGLFSAARNGAITSGGVCLAFGLVDIFVGAWSGMVISLLCAAFLGLAWNQIKD